MTNTMKMIYQKSPFQQNITPEIYPTMTMTTMNKQKTHFKVKQQQFEFHHFYFLIKKTQNGEIFMRQVYIHYNQMTMMMNQKQQMDNYHTNRLQFIVLQVKDLNHQIQRINPNGKFVCPNC